MPINKRVLCKDRTPYSKCKSPYAPMFHAKRIHDVGLPIYNGMWRYRHGWENAIASVAETAAGDDSTVYRFDLCSHTGTYIETSQHKLTNQILLDDFVLSDYVRPCKVVTIAAHKPSEEISLRKFQFALSQSGESIDAADTVIIATGWGLNHRNPDYLGQCPFFAEELVNWLCERQLHLLGVDVPVIDNARAPYGAVPKLFKSNPRLLLIAPLVIDPLQVNSGRYFLFAAPLKIEAVSASLCRPLLIEDDSSVHV